MIHSATEYHFLYGDGYDSAVVSPGGFGYVEICGYLYTQPTIQLFCNMNRKVFALLALICLSACGRLSAQTGIADNEQYYCGLGTTVYDKDGNPHTVKNEGVAMHPGDKGMELIAERIIEAIESR